MKQYFDFLPAILFFVGFKLADIFVATGVAMGASIILIAWSLIRREPVRPIQWISLGFIAVFGSLTILLHDEYYIKIKWTLFYALMGIAIFVALALKKNPLKSLMGQELVLPEKVWRQLSMAWAGYFLLLAALNQYFAMVLPLAQWVNVKIFGGMAAFIVFIIAQSFWLAKHLPDEPEKKNS
ncbi:MAG TPA: septation protein A [Usitatibacteraceae bacterium]